MNEINEQGKSCKYPSLFEKLLGYFSIFTFCLHCFYKIRTGQLIFIFNPCHVVNLVEAYLLLAPNKLRQRIVYTVLMNFLFAPWMAIAFPCYKGLIGYLEIKWFWVEHLLAALINPLVLSLSDRYYLSSTISVRNHIFSHVMYAFYQRLFLFPISQLSYANIDYALCASEGNIYDNVYLDDPFEPFIGKWYYILSEFYIFFGGEMFHRLIKFILEIMKSIQKLLLKEKEILITKNN
jgi:hypothetical protein